MDLLKREISLVGDIVGPRRATHVHWGGGTPTMLTTQDFSVIASLQKNFTFTPNAELAVEIDPAR